MLDKIFDWGVSQFTKNFLGGDKDDKDRSIMDRVIGAGASALSDKYLDTGGGGGSPRHQQVNLGVTQAKTYSMSDAKGPDTPEVVDHSLIEAKWTKIAKKLADIEDTSSRVG
tara:strand:+ start:239 stop:574 length:336 start_codon:yes stop_codon:yes gene_type:complete